MTLSEILSNEELRNHEFPVTRERIFLAHAGDCPLPRRVADAITKYAQQSTLADQENIIYPRILEETRKLASRLLNSRPEEVSLVGPTSLALSFIASGIKFRKSDNILIYFDDYPSNVYPWMALAEKGVQVRLLNIRELGQVRAIDVMGQVDENTKLVALASCHFVAGTRIDYQGIGKSLRERNILFCVDAIQTLGAFPTTTEHIDFLAADAHKWLLGPCAAGLMFVKHDLQDKLDPHIYGWNNVRIVNYTAQEQIVFRRDAHRFEVGTQNLLGIVGLHAALELLLEVGIDNIAKELLRKRALLVSALQAKGYSILGAKNGPESASGITSFFKPGDKTLPDLHKKLTAADIITSLRGDRSGQLYIRLSPHFYNTDAELHRLLELV